MQKISLFCDGSSLGNPGYGGYGVILRYKDKEKVLKAGFEDVTNNQMELKAVIEGLKALKKPCEVSIFSDSSYVVRGINEWLDKWIKKDFKGVKNPDLWRELVKVSKPHKIKAYWIKGHNGHTENERCDNMAKEEAMRVKKRSQNG